MGRTEQPRPKSKAEKWLEEFRKAAERQCSLSSGRPRIIVDGKTFEFHSDGKVYFDRQFSISLDSFRTLVDWGVEYFGSPGVEAMEKEKEQVEADLHNEKIISETLRIEIQGWKAENKRLAEENRTLNGPKYCDDCRYLNPTEKEQDQEPNPRPPHRCLREDRYLSHSGQHPRIPRPDWCPGFVAYPPFAPFLAAKHPKTGEWRRWEFDRNGKPIQGDFYLPDYTIGVAILKHGEWYQGRCWILRDAGPILGGGA